MVIFFFFLEYGDKADKSIIIMKYKYKFHIIGTNSRSSVMVRIKIFIFFIWGEGGTVSLAIVTATKLMFSHFHPASFRMHIYGYSEPLLLLHTQLVHA